MRGSIDTKINQLARTRYHGPDLKFMLRSTRTHFPLVAVSADVDFGQHISAYHGGILVKISHKIDRVWRGHGMHNAHASCYGDLRYYCEKSVSITVSQNF